MYRITFLAVLLIPVFLGSGCGWLTGQGGIPEGETFDSDGVSIYFTNEGQGTPVILVHGYKSTANLNWRLPGITQSLRDAGYQVIAMDCRGHGQSGKPTDPEAYGTEMCLDVVRLMDHLGIQKAHIVGYSMGGYITLKLLEMHPERFISAAPCGMTWGMAKRLGRGSVNPEAQNSEENFMELDELETSEENPRFPRLQKFNRKEPDALTAVRQSFPEFQVDEATLRNNTIPAITIIGSEDPLARNAELMHQTMANHQLVLIAGTGHISTIRHPEFKSALVSFLSEHSGN